MATNCELYIDQGADWYLYVEYTDPYDAPIDLTGYTAKMQLREYTSSSSAALTLATNSGITIDAAAGKITVHATATQTSSLTLPKYVYDLKITSPSGIVTRLIQGNANIDDEVSRG